MAEHPSSLRFSLGSSGSAGTRRQLFADGCVGQALGTVVAHWVAPCRPAPARRSRAPSRRRSLPPTSWCWCRCPTRRRGPHSTSPRVRLLACLLACLGFEPAYLQPHRGCAYCAPGLPATRCARAHILLFYSPVCARTFPPFSQAQVATTRPQAVAEPTRVTVGRLLKCFCESTQAPPCLPPPAGKAKYDAKRHALVWKLKKFAGEVEHTLAASVELIATTRDRKPWSRPPLSMSFQVRCRGVWPPALAWCVVLLNFFFVWLPVPCLVCCAAPSFLWALAHSARPCVASRKCTALAVGLSHSPVQLRHPFHQLSTQSGRPRTPTPTHNPTHSLSHMLTPPPPDTPHPPPPTLGDPPAAAQVPMHSASGVRVQYLKVWEKSSYKVGARQLPGLCWRRGRPGGRREGLPAHEGGHASGPGWGLPGAWPTPRCPPLLLCPRP